MAIRVFQCTRFPGLDIIGTGHFVNGILRLDDAAAVARLQAHEWYGHIIREVAPETQSSIPVNVIRGAVSTVGTIQNMDRAPVRPPEPAVDPAWLEAERVEQEIAEKSALPSTPTVADVARMPSEELSVLAMRLGLQMTGDETTAQIRDMLIESLDRR